MVGKGSYTNTIKGPNNRMISVEEIKQIVGSQDKPKLKASKELQFNKNISYTDFDTTVKAIAKEALMLDIRREKKDVIRLIVDRGVCQGVEVGDYNIIIKKETVVAAGP